LGELELVVALLQREDKEDETWNNESAQTRKRRSGNVPMMYSMKEMNLWWVARGSSRRSTIRMCLK
jgi:hypothetical protein